MKTLVIGLDGASWNIIEPMMASGDLPNISELVRKGVWGPLRSVNPPVTIPAWKSFTTGRSPSSLGIYNWVTPDFEGHQFVWHNSASFQARDFWEYLNEQGIRTGVINVPGTYPVSPLKGFMISGILTPEEHDYTYPPELASELIQSYGYRVNYSGPNLRTTEKAEATEHGVAQIKELIRSRFRVARDYARSVDCLAMVVQKIDELQHVFYDGEPTREAWKIIDQEIGDLLASVGDCNVFIVSDHGFQEAEIFFYMNNWLLQNGYLKLRQPGRYVHFGARLASSRARSNVTRFLDRVGIWDTLKALIPRQQDLVGNIAEAGWYDARALQRSIQWEETDAVQLGAVIYCRNGDIASKLSDRLRGIEAPGSAHPLFEEVTCLPRQSVVLTEKSKGFDTRVRYGNDMLWDDRPFLRGIHAAQGVFVAYGPGIRERGVHVEGACLIDMAPTLLHLYGVPIPHEVEGKVIGPVSPCRVTGRPSSRASESAAPKGERTAYTSEEERKIAGRLARLGYLD